MRLEIDGDQRFLDLAGEGALRREKHVLGELLGERATALHHGVGAGVLGERADRAHDVDAEMFVEAAILGGERRLDHHVRDFFERHRVVAKQAALADLIAEPIEEGDAILVRQVHLAVRDLEGGQREDEHDDKAGTAPASAPRRQGR